MNAAVTLGPTLDVVPYVNADGYTIEMSVTPSITFLDTRILLLKQLFFSGNSDRQALNPELEIAH